MNNLFNLVYVIFSSGYRDAFGKNGYNLPILKNRFVQHVLGFLATLSLCVLTKGIVWYWAVWIAVWVQIYWAIGHGFAYDLSTHGEPDEEMLKRYKKAVGYKFVCKFFDEKDWYTFGFDFILLTIRYTYPLIPIVYWFGPVLLSLGLVISGLYALYRYCPYVRTKRLLDVEIWAGFATGLFISFLS